jgi:hypothetical protein
LCVVLYIFRRIYGPKYEDGEWKSRTNRELEDLSKGENIVRWIKGQRISWLGHLERMEEDRMPKQIFTQELEKTKRRGRPRKGWREEVESDLHVLGVRRWRELVIDREKWRGVFRQVKVHNGLERKKKKKKDLSLHGLPAVEPRVLVEHRYLQHLSTMAYSNYCTIYC